MTIIDNLTIEIYQKNLNNWDIDKLLKSIIEELDELPVDEYYKIIDELNGYKKIRYDYIEELDLYYHDPFSFTLGEYIDLQSFHKKSKLDMLTTLCWRKRGDVDSFSDFKPEPWGSFNIGKRAEILKKLSIKYFYQIESDFLKLESIIKKNYPRIFTTPDDSPEPVIKDKRELAKIKAEKIKMENFQKESWFRTVWGLSGENILNIPQIYNLPIFTVLRTIDLKIRLNDEK
jgi:hypothetical protein